MKFVIILLFTIMITMIVSQKLDYSDEKTWPALCKKGTSQSPIDFNSNYDYKTAKGHLKLLIFNYKPLVGSLSFMHEHKLGYVCPTGTDCGKITAIVDGIACTYKFADLHVHLGSEHTLNTHRPDMEIHLVHTLDETVGDLTKLDIIKNKYLVLGILLKADEKSDLAELNKLNADTLAPFDNFNPQNLVKATDSFYHYKGSLTTPGCEEAVNWVVFNQAVNFGTKQKEAFNKHFKTLYPVGNARKTQKLGIRQIYISISNKLLKINKI